MAVFVKLPEPKILPENLTSILRQSLALARDHVAKGEILVERQQQIVADLESRGADTTEARKLLRQFEEAQTTNIVHVARLEEELAAVLQAGTSALKAAR